MSDTNDISPGQLRLFEGNQGWLPADTAGESSAADGNGAGNTGGYAIVGNADGATDGNTGMDSGNGSANSNDPASFGTAEPKPLTWQQLAQKSAMNNGGYFSHDNKMYQRRDGKTYLVTGDAMGDVELDADQTARLDRANEEQGKADAARQEERKTAEWTPEGYSPDPDGPTRYSPETEIILGKLTPEEKEWISTNVAGPFAATVGIAKGLREGFPSPVKMAGNAAVGAALGYAGGRNAGKFYLDTFDPSVPRIQNKK